MKHIGLSVIFAVLLNFTGSGTACDGPCENNTQTDRCELITEKRFQCLHETTFVESRSFKITSYHNKLYTCNTTSVNHGIVTFECPFNKNFTGIPINLTITATDYDEDNTRDLQTNLTKLFRPKKISNVQITMSNNIGISLQGDIDQGPLQANWRKIVYVTFYSSQNFHEPIRNCWVFRNFHINETQIGFHPFEMYQVSMYWKVENGDYCSPVTVKSIRTQPSKPTAAPQILKGSYSDTLHNNKSALYWKAISKYHENGPLVEYIIYKLPTHIMKDNYALMHNFTSLIKLDNVSHLFNLSNLEQFQIATVDKSVCSLMFSHDVVPGDHLLIRTSNSVGPSDAYTSIEFTSEGKHMVQQFLARQLNQSYFELSWNSTIEMDTTFEVILYWCNGIYWTLPGWTECQNNISEITLASSELERKESSFKLIQIIPPDTLPKATSPPFHKSIASKLLSADDTLPTSYLQFGVSIYYDEEFSPIVWNTTTLSDVPAQENHLVIYIIIAVGVVIALIVFLIFCVCFKRISKKCVLQKYKITMPVTVDQCDSDGAEGSALPTSNSDWDVEKQRHDSGVEMLSVSTSSLPQYSSSSSPQIIIPVSSSGTSNTSSTGESQNGTLSSETITNSSPVNRESSKQDALRTSLKAKALPNTKPIGDSLTYNSSPVLLLKPKLQLNDKEVADKSQLVEYSIATIQEIKDNESGSEDSSSSTSLPFIKSNRSHSSDAKKQTTTAES